jgi:hypothetical protein
MKGIDALEAHVGAMQQGECGSTVGSRGHGYLLTVVRLVSVLSAPRRAACFSSPFKVLHKYESVNKKGDT